MLWYGRIAYQMIEQQNYLPIEIGKFIEDFTGVDRNCVTDDMTLLSDLGLDGSDAIDFFQAFSDRF